MANRNNGPRYFVSRSDLRPLTKSVFHSIENAAKWVRTNYGEASGVAPLFIQDSGFEVCGLVYCETLFVPVDEVEQ